MEMKVRLTYACMNLKKLAKIKEKQGLLGDRKPYINLIIGIIRLIKEKWLWDSYPRAVLLLINLKSISD